MKYRKSAIAAAMAVSAIALSACSSTGDDPSAAPSSGDVDYTGETLTVMHYEGEESAMGIAWARAIEIFEEQTGATVEVQATSFEDLNASAGQLFDSSDAPDVSEYNKGNGTAGQLAATGVIQNLDDAYAEFGWADKLGAGIDTIAKYDENGVMGSGSFYGVPNYGEFVFLYFNQDMFDEYGISVPTNEAELASAMQTFVDAGVTPLTTSAQEYPMGQLWYQLALSQADRQWVNDYQLYENPVDWQGDEVTYATETLQEYVDKGYIASDVSSVKAEDAGVSFINGTSPIFVSGSWWFGRFVSEATGFDWTLQAFPESDLSLGSSGNLWVVPENAANKELAYEFIDITMRPEIQAIIGNNGGVPVAADPADITDEKSAELIATFNGILDNDGLSFYPDWPAPGFYDVLVQELQGLVTGVQDVEATNANLGEQYDEGTAEFR